jgi:natural product precursor
MKKVKFSGKLNLNKETIVILNDSQMTTVQGGDSYVSSVGPCYSKGYACAPASESCAMLSCPAICNPTA